MATVLFVVVAVLALTATALAAVGRLGELPEARSDRDSFVMPAGSLAAHDLVDVRFGVGFRGYRMHEVDLVLDRLRAQLAERERAVAPHDDADQPSGGASG